MYIQLTDKCNMTCAHCCMSCTGKGTFMSQAVFDKALEIAASREEYITLGGGEPTLHPKCLEWCMQAALATVDTSESMGGPAVLIITNGKKTEVAQKLAKLSKLGVISAELSQDEFHDAIDERTVAIFERYAGIRDVTMQGQNPVLDVGRARESHEAGLLNVREGCACETLFIAPNGDFYQCGCKTKKLGNIMRDEIPDEYWENADRCQRDLDQEAADNFEDEAAEIKKFRMEPVPA